MQISGSPYVGVNPFIRYQSETSAASAAQDDAAKPVAPVEKTNAINQEQQPQIQQLKARDREVRNHEQAHLSAAGGIAISGASFQFVVGPDGRRYAVGGEVSIDTSEVANDPEATLRKAETIRRAALAPAQPSSQDYSVANQAAAMASKASAELLREQQGPDRNGSILNVRV